MKRIFLIPIFSLSVFFACAQTDSSRIMQTITLKQLYHNYLISYLGGFGSTDILNYIIQFKKQYVAGNDSTMITVTIPSQLFVNVYGSLATQPEGETSEYNLAIKALVIPQITNAWLGRQIMDIINQNKARRDAHIQEVRDKINQISL